MTSPKTTLEAPKRNTAISVALSEEEKSALRKMAYEDYCGVATFVRKLILKKLKRNGFKR